MNNDHENETTMNTETKTETPTKARLMSALYAFAAQRPGLDYGNYGNPQSYRAEVRAIGRDLRHARQLLRAVELRESITAEMILEGLRQGYSGRLSWTGDGLSYCTGQYWPTEYRRAVCAVCASVLWYWVRSTSMPEPTKDKRGESIYDGLSAGAWLRRFFRREFGRGIASRWFN